MYTPPTGTGQVIHLMVTMIGRMVDAIGGLF